MALEDAKTQIDHAFMREDARGLSYENAFAGAVSFLRRKYTKDLAVLIWRSQACPLIRR